MSCWPSLSLIRREALSSHKTPWRRIFEMKDTRICLLKITSVNSCCLSWVWLTCITTSHDLSGGHNFTWSVWWTWFHMICLLDMISHDLSGGHDFTWSVCWTWLNLFCLVYTTSCDLSCGHKWYVLWTVVKNRVVTELQKKYHIIMHYKRSSV